MLLQQGDEFFFKSALFVMLLLISDVLNNCEDIGTTYAERAVPLLPGEFATLFVGPTRRIRFDGENRLGDGQSGRYLNEKMNMDFDAADGIDVDFEFFADTCHVRPELRLKWDMCRTSGANLRYIPSTQRLRTGLSSVAPTVLRREDGHDILCPYGRKRQAG